MPATQTEFDSLQEKLTNGGVDSLLDHLVVHMRDAGKYHELFEVLKLGARHKLGLPVLQTESAEDLADDVRDKLELGLLDACREVGLLLMESGHVRDGWMYLRPVGDKAVARRALAKVDADEDNIDEIVEVALHEGVDPARGYDLVLEHYGTCNAITMLESTMPQQSPADQRALADLLLKHVHQELTATVKADIAQQQGTDPAEPTLGELVADRDWLFGEGSYHIDTTHLAATVRFARVLQDPESLKLALDLTEYGRRLDPQFQYQGDEPFTDMYPSHALYFRALLGDGVDDAVEFFRDKAASLPIAEHGAMAAEVYVELLSRLGRVDEAIEATKSMLSGDVHLAGVAPSLAELCQQAGTFAPMIEHYRDREDMLGYAVGLILDRSK